MIDLLSSLSWPINLQKTCLLGEFLLTVSLMGVRILYFNFMKSLFIILVFLTTNSNCILIKYGLPMLLFQQLPVLFEKWRVNRTPHYGVFDHRPFTVLPGALTWKLWTYTRWSQSPCQRPVKRNWCSKRDFFFNMERRWNETSISFHIIFFHINFYIFTLNLLGLVGLSSFFIQSLFGTISYSVVT